MKSERYWQMLKNVTLLLSQTGIMKTKLIINGISKLVLGFILIAILPFLPAGTLCYTHGVVLSAAMAHYKCIAHLSIGLCYVC